MSSRELDQRQGREIVTGSAESVDRVRAALKAALGSAPAVGSVLSGAFELLWGPAFERRTRTMLEILLEKVLDLEDDVATIDHLISRLGNEDVAAIGLSAVTMAGRAPCDEKLRHLATCVAQIIEERSPWVDDIEYSQMLLHLVDQLTTTQLAILHFLADPRGWERRTGESLDGIPLDDGRLPSDRILCRGFPAFEKRPVALRAVIGGLEARGLLSVTGLRDDGSGYTGIDQFREGSASELGLELIEFLDLGR